MTVEMSHDRNIPDWYKEQITPSMGIGASGTYFIKDRNGKRIAVFKPQLQEQGMAGNPGKGYRENFQRRGLEQGTCYLKEYVASQMDSGNRVPPTQLLSFNFASKWTWNGRREIPELATMKDQIGSYQRFLHDVEGSITKDKALDLPTKELQTAACCMIRWGQGDGNFGNFLYSEQESKLYLIDNGIMFFDDLDPRREIGIGPTQAWSEAVKWSKKLDQEIDSKVREWIADHDINKDCERLEKVGISPGAILTFGLRSLFLKEGVRLGIPISKLIELSTQKQPRPGIKAKDLWIDTLVKQTKAALKPKFKDQEFIDKFQELLAIELPKQKKP